MVMERVLDQQVVGQIRELFAALEQPVQILFFGSTAGCDYCGDTRGMLEEVAALDEKLDLRVYDLEADKDIAQRFQVDRAPAIVVAARDGDEVLDLGIRFFGIPAGHEFNTLVHDILLVSRRDSGLSPETRTALKGVDRPLLLQVFVTPTCPYCPQAVLLAHRMAMENPRLIRAEGVEATEFRELAQRFHVSGVPQTVVNSGAQIVVGAVPEQRLLAEILRAGRD